MEDTGNLEMASLHAIHRSIHNQPDMIFKAIHQAKATLTRTEAAKDNQIILIKAAAFLRAH